MDVIQTEFNLELYVKKETGIYINIFLNLYIYNLKIIHWQDIFIN